MDRLRVTHILEATVGGTARALELAARHLPPLGIELSCIVGTERDPAFPKALQASAPQVEVVTAPLVRTVSPATDWHAARVLEKELRRLRPDVIHTHSSKAGFLGRWTGRKTGARVVHTPHVFAMEWSDRAVYRWAERLARGWTDRLIVLNEEQGALARSLLGYDDRAIVEIHNGVDTSAFHPPKPEERAGARSALNVKDGDVVIGTALRLEPQKGIGHLLKAAKSILATHPKVRFLIAGEGSLAETLKERHAAMGLGERVQFLGRLEHMPAFYHALDALVLGSLWEGMPYAVLEAQACGLPVIAAATPGTRALIEDGGTGWLCPPGNADALANALARCLAEPEEAVAMGGRARERVMHRHSVDHWAEQLAGLYRTLAGERP